MSETKLRDIHNFMLEHEVFMTHRVCGGDQELTDFEDFQLLMTDPTAFHKKWDFTEADMHHLMASKGNAK